MSQPPLMQYAPVQLSLIPTILSKFLVICVFNFAHMYILLLFYLFINKDYDGYLCLFSAIRNTRSCTC